MKQEELQKILKLHEKWLNGEDGGVKANLSDANLCYADLSDANLRGANLSGADLNDANLRGANLSFALMDGFVYQLSRIGSSNRMTTFWADRDIVWCGCFTGTFKDWRDKIRKTYTADEEYRKQYEAALKYFAELAAVDGMTRFKEMLVEKER